MPLSDDQINELERLQRLRESGVVDESEFTELKREILVLTPQVDTQTSPLPVELKELCEREPTGLTGLLRLVVAARPQREASPVQAKRWPAFFDPAIS